jgi:hypothetical protein
MGVNDDLSMLFPKPSVGAQVGQGTILTWDPLTGENTVEWAGSVLINVPILNTAEAITLKPDHVVVLLGQGNSWFIIGRVTKPGDPSFASASVGFDAENGQATAFALSTSLVTKASCVLDVPAWADEVAIMAVGACTVVNPTVNADFAACAVFIDGVTGPGLQNGHAPAGDLTIKNNHIGAMTASSARVYSVTGGSTITCDMRIRSVNAAWGAHGSNIAEISAMAIFRSTT